MIDADGDARDGTLAGTRRRRPATVEEAKALAHPLRLRILRLCAEQELTNKQLADRLDRDPATVYYHVRQLAEVGFLGAGTVRTGPSGALEKPYRTTQNTWWLEDPLAQVGSDTAGLLFEAFQDELRAAGPGAVQWADRFMLHLSADDVAELERRILAILDEYVETDHERRDQPAYGGLVALHRLVDPSRPESAGD